MRRSGFTMVELIFVIVIIGILAATALPKFGGTKDNAKSSSEMATMGSLDGAIVGAKEFRLQDYKDTNVIWHEVTTANATDTTFKAHNTNHRVLKTILNKGEQFYIVGVVGMEGNETNTSNTISQEATDILLITGPASDSSTGIKQPADDQGGDIPGRPDKSDFWVFNPNNVDINVSHNSIVGSTAKYSIVPAQSLKLVDFNASSAVDVTTIYAGIGTATGAKFAAVAKK